MANPYYSQSPVGSPGLLVRAAPINGQLVLIEAAFDAIVTALVATTGNQTIAGNKTFTGATVFSGTVALNGAVTAGAVAIALAAATSVTVPAPTLAASPTRLSDLQAAAFAPATYPWTQVSVNTNVQAFNGYAVDTSASSLTMTLPASPASGDTVLFLDSTGDADIYPFTIARNGNTIMGLAEDLVFDLRWRAVGLQYINNTWKLV